MRMFFEETNAAVGVLGKKIELIGRNGKASAYAAVRVSRVMILKDSTLTSAEGKDHPDRAISQDQSAGGGKGSASLRVPNCERIPPWKAARWRKGKDRHDRS
jgi:hypothetical protein